MESKSTSSSKGSSMPSINLSWLTRPSRVYIVEHFMSLILLALIAISGIGLFNSVFDHYLGETTQETSIYGYDDYYIEPAAVLPTLQFSDIAEYLSIAIVVVPLFALVYVRSRKAERAHKDLLENRARRRMEYVWLSIAGLFMLGYTVVLVNETINEIMGTEVASAESWWQKASKLIFTIVFIGLVSMLVARVTPGLPTNGGKNAGK